MFGLKGKGYWDNKTIATQKEHIKILENTIELKDQTIKFKDSTIFNQNSTIAHLTILARRAGANV